MDGQHKRIQRTRTLKSTNMITVKKNTKKQAAKNAKKMKEAAERMKESCNAKRS